ncbi:hypothetical protein [Actinoallomurus sp. CA-142502]|uniref:Secreted protein n=2 Tax=Actinoallomurus iriomotensis TaxID=478107 RepID=A0A9W6S1G8_9ACTN|nr:hypothetical protein Airi01_086020 [Actinoallomurus iriomotensis]GLY86771.1 hypothetical protein Airi02_047000 [Actinoallomurus iriomotensis]
MMRKTLVSLALAAGVAGGALATAGSASAATFVPGGVYPSVQACSDAGNAGFPQGRWVGFYCQSLGYGQYELWVQPTY